VGQCIRDIEWCNTNIAHTKHTAGRFAREEGTGGILWPPVQHLHHLILGLSRCHGDCKQGLRRRWAVASSGAVTANQRYPRSGHHGKT
jgi:hypothetical protein